MRQITSTKRLIPSATLEKLEKYLKADRLAAKRPRGSSRVPLFLIFSPVSIKRSQVFWQRHARTNNCKCKGEEVAYLLNDGTACRRYDEDGDDNGKRKRERPCVAVWQGRGARLLYKYCHDCEIRISIECEKETRRVKWQPSGKRMTPTSSRKRRGRCSTWRLRFCNKAVRKLPVIY